MRVIDEARSLGVVIGMALTERPEGRASRWCRATYRTGREALQGDFKTTLFMKLKLTLFLLPSLGLVSIAEAILGAFTAGGTVTSNGSVLVFGQPFVGRMEASGVTLELGILARVPDPDTPQALSPQTLYLDERLIGQMEFSSTWIQFNLWETPPNGFTYVLEHSEDLVHWERLASNELAAPMVSASQAVRFFRVKQMAR